MKVSPSGRFKKNRALEDRPIPFPMPMRCIFLSSPAIAAAGLNDNDVRINVAKSLPTIFVDSRLIQQALGALLSNAVGHGNLPIDLSAARDDSMLVISVADHGPGLAPGEEHKVFEKFYRGPRTRPGGLGLGLSIARQLIEAHSGEIVVRNREGGGARFSIRLPLG